MGLCRIPAGVTTTVRDTGSTGTPLHPTPFHSPPPITPFYLGFSPHPLHACAFAFVGSPALTYMPERHFRADLTCLPNSWDGLVFPLLLPLGVPRGHARIPPPPTCPYCCDAILLVRAAYPTHGGLNVVNVAVLVCNE